jgi:hypothetical protein
MSEILNQFRDEELPPSTVDVGQATRAGRRRRRIRTGLAAGGVAAALAVAGAAAPTLLSAQPSPPPPADPQCGSPVPARPSMPTWQQFDPLTLEIDATDVPGYHLRISASSTNWQIVVLEKEGANDAGAGVVYVVQYACGGEPRTDDAEADQLVPFDPAAGEPADPIGGAPAYWLPPAGVLPGGLAGAGAGLAWQWTAGAWVVVFAEPASETSTVDPAVLRSAAAEVAPQLELGVGIPVTAPFSLPLPAGTYPAVTATHWASDSGELFPVGFSIGFDNVGKAASTQPFPTDYVPSFGVNASAYTTFDDLPSDATEYPEDLGYPAYQALLPYEGQDIDELLVYDVFGFGFQLQPAEVPGTSTRAERLGMAADVFRTITVYPDAATDYSAWGDPIAP